ncbi:hypothetical protein ACEOWJ_002146 [Bacillus cereus]
MGRWIIVTSEKHEPKLTVSETKELQKLQEKNKEDKEDSLMMSSLSIHKSMKICIHLLYFI